MRTSGVPPLNVAYVGPVERNATEAAKELSKDGDKYEVFGPYQTQEDRDVTNRTALDQLAIVSNSRLPWSDPVAAGSIRQSRSRNSPT